MLRNHLLLVGGYDPDRLGAVRPLALVGTGKHVHFADGAGPGPDIAGLQRALNRRGVSDSDLFESLVHDGLHGCTQPNGRARDGTASASVRSQRLLRSDPARDFRPMLLKCARPHEQADMAAGHGFLTDAVLRCPEILRRVKDLFGRCDIVGSARQQIGRASDVMQIEFAAETDELALRRAGSP